MRLLLYLTVCLMGLLTGCASLEGSGPDGLEGQPSTVTVACTNTQARESLALLDWELKVSPEPIESGKPFTAVLDGTMVFPEFLLDGAQQVVPEGWQRFDLVDFKATVHVRSGATGPDVVLRPEPISYTCSVGGNDCDRGNDLEGVPGLRGNTDCQPEGPTNQCGRFISLPTSTDCSAEGECDRLGKLEQCIAHEFCVTGDLRIELEQESAQYRADERGNVLFGWDDVNTGATQQEGGPNDGTWVLPEASYSEPIRSNGLRMIIEGFLPLGLDCTMGVYSQGDFGVLSLDSLSSPTPDEALISFPIE